MGIVLATLLYAGLSTPFTADAAPDRPNSKYLVPPSRQTLNETLNSLTFIFEAHCGRLRARGAHKGNNLVYCADARKVGYDVAVRSGADLERIHLDYEGADSLITHEEGNLLTSAGSVGWYGASRVPIRKSTSDTGADRASSVAADSVGAAHVTGHTNSTNCSTNTGAYRTGEGKSEIPAAARTIAVWTIPLSIQLYARNSRESLCNGF